LVSCFQILPKNKIKDRSSTKTRKDENSTKQQMRSGKKTKILDTKSKKGTLTMTFQI